MNWTPEQQREHRRLWVEALRSGKYQQVTRHLRRNGGMCCLGVGCEVSGLGSWTENDTYVVGDAVPAHIIMPKPVREFYGIAEGEGGYVGGGLTHANDSLGKTFAEIADIIESEPEGLIAKATP